jgi:hypothetical protein
MQRNQVYRIIALLVVVLAACAGPASAVYRNNETIWTSSGAQVVMETWLDNLEDGTVPTHWSDAYSLTIKPSEDVWVMTPFTYPTSRSGVTPKVRYLYFQMKMPVGVNATVYSVYSGPNLIRQDYVTWKGTGLTKLYKLDLGSFYTMNRGINAGVHVENTRATSQTVFMYGAGAKQEW